MNTREASPTIASEFHIGQQASFDVDIDAALIDRFADLSGDHNPLHVDDDYGAKTFLGGRVAHGMICGALFSQLVGEHLPGERALYRSQEMRFIKPIRPGTQITVAGEVTAIDSELNVMTMQTSVTDRTSGELYVDGTAEVVLRVDPVESGATPELHAHRPLAGKRVMLIGGSGGIGKHIARDLAMAGADLHFSFRSRGDAAAALRAELAALGATVASSPLDLRDSESIRAFVDAVTAGDHGIDGIVFCGHGDIVQKGIARGAVDDVRDAFERAVGALYQLVQGTLPKLNAGASIVAISSTVTLEPPPPNWAAYTIAKSAQLGLIRSLAVELGPRRIRCNAVAPTLTMTNKNQALPPRILKDFIARSPLGRLSEPGDVARAVRFLLSDESSFITGVNLPLAGGSVNA